MQAVGRTDKGLVREINQDYIYTSAEPVGPLPNLFLVADGMGGHNAGDFASRFLVQQLVAAVKEQPSGKPEVQVLKESIAAANYQLYEKAS